MLCLEFIGIWHHIRDIITVLVSIAAAAILYTVTVIAAATCIAIGVGRDIGKKCQHISDLLRGIGAGELEK